MERGAPPALPRLTVSVIVVTPNEGDDADERATQAWLYMDSVHVSIHTQGTSAVLLSISKHGPPFNCGKCGTCFDSRNSLFKHLKAVCAPLVATMKPAKAPPVRVALALAYIGVRAQPLEFQVECPVAVL